MIGWILATVAIVLLAGSMALAALYIAGKYMEENE